MKDWKEIQQIYQGLCKLYYRNKTLLGIVRFVVAMGGMFFLFIGLQYVYYFGSWVRTFLFYLFILLFLSLLILWVIRPLAQRFRFISGVKRMEINNILKSQFPAITDRFLNMLELVDVFKGNDSGNELTEASIQQKLKVVKQFPLADAFRFVLPRAEKWSLIFLAGVVLLVGIGKSNFVSKGFFQYTHYRQEFSPSPDFTFVLLNDSLAVKKGSSFKIEARLQGRNFPEQLNVVMNGNRMAMKVNGDGSFSYSIGNVYHDLQFQLNGGSYYSSAYHIRCLPVPLVRSFSLEVVPPGYTGLKKFVLQNQGDAEVPVGSHLFWTVNSVDADSLFLSFGKLLQPMKEGTRNSFSVDSSVSSQMEYFFRASNQYFTNDGLVYNLKVLNDELPTIVVNQVQDTVNLTSFYFHGHISDDYGIKSVKFHVAGGEIDTSLNVAIHTNRNPQDFFYGYNFSSMKPGVYRYWFTVADNDVLHHFKEKQSKVFTFRFPGFKEIELQNKNGYSQLQENLNEGKEVTRNIQQDFGKMRRQMLNGQLTDWEKKQIAEGIKKQSGQLQQLMQNVSNENRRLNNLSKNFSQLSPALLQKQKQVEQLMDQLYSDELKKLFDEFNSLLNQFDQKKFDELTKDLNYRLDDLNKQLDRNIAMLKKMQVEKSIQDIQNNLEKLANGQQEFSDEVKRSSHMTSDSLRNMLRQQSEAIHQTFSALDSTAHQNEELDRPYSINKSGSLQKKISKDLNTLSDMDGKGKRRQQSEVSERIARSLKQMADNLNKSMLSSQMEIDWVQIRRLQYLAANILTFSFQQEKLMMDMTGVPALDPSLTSYLDKQKNLVQFEAQLRDTLYLLSKQAPQINAQIGKESLDWKFYTDKALSNLEESQYPKGRVNQQFSMASANNLALYLSEALQQVMDMMKNAQPGDGSCNKPGGKGSSMPGLKAIQDKLKKQMQSMMNDLKNGVKPGNAQIGKMLMQQEILQQAIQEQVLKGNLGPDVETQLKEAQRLLRQNRNDLLSKNITQQTVNRQNLIFEHLLDARNAKMQRNSDNERESESAINQLVSHPKSYFNNDKTEENEFDIMSGSAWRMNYFYRKKFNSYLKNINGQ